jgi:hypothetical protein
VYPRRDARTDRYGFLKHDGWVIDPQYAYAHPFQNGYAAVLFGDGQPGLITADGTPIPLKSLCSGRVPVGDESISFAGFHDHDSQTSRYAAICTARWGRREWGLIDTSLGYTPLPNEVFGKATYAVSAGEYILFHRKVGRGSAGDLQGLFSLVDMRLELPAEFSCIYPSEGPIWVACRTEGESRFAFYDLRTHRFLPGQYWEASPFSCGFGAVRHEHGPSYFVREDLRPAFDAEFDDVGRFSYGLAAVYKADDSGYIDTSGEMRLLLPYDRLQRFNTFGLAIANRDEAEWNIDVIDRHGRARLTRLETAVFWDGDYPYFEVTKEGEEQLFDVNLQRVV